MVGGTPLRRWNPSSWQSRPPQSRLSCNFFTPKNISPFCVFSPFPLTKRRIGRRPLFLASSSLVTLCLLMVGCAFMLNWTSMLTLFWLCMFMFTFSLGLGPVTFVVASEVRLDDATVAVAVRFLALCCRS